MTNELKAQSGLPSPGRLSAILLWPDPGTESRLWCAIMAMHSSEPGAASRAVLNLGMGRKNLKE